MSYVSLVPELQGEPEDIAKEKVKIAAKTVGVFYIILFKGINRSSHLLLLRTPV